MTPRIIITPKARKDLVAIGSYTEKQWGKGQRKKYLAQLNTRIQRLAQNPEHGRLYHELPRAPRGYHEGRHVIFYLPLPRGIEIIRVLYDAMDFSSHFV